MPVSPSIITGEQDLTISNGTSISFLAYFIKN